MNPPFCFDSANIGQKSYTANFFTKKLQKKCIFHLFAPRYILFDLFLALLFCYRTLNKHSRKENFFLSSDEKTAKSPIHYKKYPPHEGTGIQSIAIKGYYNSFTRTWRYLIPSPWPKKPMWPFLLNKPGWLRPSTV